jgi:hypothetical protein
MAMIPPLSPHAGREIAEYGGELGYRLFIL